MTARFNSSERASVPSSLGWEAATGTVRRQGVRDWAAAGICSWDILLAQDTPPTHNPERERPMRYPPSSGAAESDVIKRHVAVQITSVLSNNVTLEIQESPCQAKSRDCANLGLLLLSFACKPLCRI